MAAQFGRRLRKGATTTAVAAAAVAALSASQAPGVTPATAGGGGQEAADATPPPGTPVTGNSPYYTDLPPLNTPNNLDLATGKPVTGAGEAGIPATVLAAYKQAESTVAETDPACRLPWQLLAAIGKVESGQARGGRVDANGTTSSPILGPVLNGVGFANIPDTDGGQYDGDTVHDRAVGPMQFIPSTWATWGQDANGDGRKDPNNIYDAALAAGRYLCHGDRDLTIQSDLDRAVLGYNHSREYLRTVMSWFEYYQRGTHEVPDGTGALPVGNGPDSATRPTPVPSPDSPGPKPSPSPSKPGGKPSPSPSPSKPGEGSGGDSGDSGDSGDPKPTPSPVVVDTVENAGTGRMTATAGQNFAVRAKVRVKDSEGEPVARQKVRFSVIGDTDSRFPEGASSVVLLTDADGTVTAPALRAGEKTGTFVVRAALDGTKHKPVDLVATVTERMADKLTAELTELTAAPETAFADRLVVAATSKGAAAAGVTVTATVTAEGGQAPGDQGPYFKDDSGEPVRTLTGLPVGEDGRLTLPELFADGTEGTFTLHLTTKGAATLTVVLTVKAPAEPTPDPGTTPSPAPSPSPSEPPAN